MNSNLVFNRLANVQKRSQGVEEGVKFVIESLSLSVREVRNVIPRSLTTGEPPVWIYMRSCWISEKESLVI